LKNSVVALNEDCLDALDQDNYEHVLENYKKIKELINIFLKV